MEQKAKKYEELTAYERAMTNLSLEQRLEAMARDLQQITKALKVCIHIDSNFYEWKDDSGVAVIFIGEGKDSVTNKAVEKDGDLMGVIDKALTKIKESKEEAKESPSTD